MGEALSSTIFGEEIRIGHWELRPFLCPGMDDPEAAISVIVEETIHHAICHIATRKVSLAFDNLSQFERINIGLGK